MEPTDPLHRPVLLRPTPSPYGAGFLEPGGKRSVGLENDLASRVFRRPESLSVPPRREKVHSPSKRGLSSTSEHFFLKAMEGNTTLRLPVFLKPARFEWCAFVVRKSQWFQKACRFGS